MTLKLQKIDNKINLITDNLHDVDTVSLGVWVRTGARNEVKELNGISHFLEHMAFKGTTTRSAKEIAEEIENVGGVINAYTSREVTAYYVKLLKEDVNLGLDILSDIYQNSIFIPEEMERERGVIIQEINQSLDSPEDVVYNNFQKLCYTDQPMGRTILGDEEIIRQITREDMVNYMKTNYTASRTAVSVCGKFDEAEIKDLVSLKFKNLSTETVAPALKANYTGGFNIQKSDHEQVNIVLGFDGVGYLDKDFYPSSILGSVLGGGMSSRLFQEVREKHGLCYSIYSFSQSSTDSGTFIVSAGTSKEEANKLIDLVAKELKGAIGTITEEELNRSKNQFKASLLMAREDSQSRCEQNARQLLLRGRLIDVSETLEKINAVKIDDLHRVLQKTLSSKMSFSALGPVGNLYKPEEIEGKFKL
ncbi:MAG: Insulinase (Peptidase family M16) [Alphaproteobacteria bacterium ADurb.Bin438]|nr:MAG: Insulinase (Peptidase family M16) [Alphaproteobacteria bacterium ADurb.Bin438]